MLSSTFGVIAWLLYEKCLTFVKQWILKQQLSLKDLMEAFSAKAEVTGVDFYAVDFRQV